MLNSSLHSASGSNSFTIQYVIDIFYQSRAFPMLCDFLTKLCGVVNIRRNPQDQQKRSGTPASFVRSLPRSQLQHTAPASHRSDRRKIRFRSGFTTPENPRVQKTRRFGPTVSTRSLRFHPDRPHFAEFILAKHTLDVPTRAFALCSYRRVHTT